MCVYAFCAPLRGCVRPQVRATLSRTFRVRSMGKLMKLDVLIVGLKGIGIETGEQLVYLLSPLHL